MASPIVMHSMELDDEDMLDMAAPIGFPGNDKPQYPCGLMICITDKELRKLKMDFPDGEVIGGTVHGHFMGRIKSASQSDGESGPGCRLEIQIEDLCLESEDLENEAADLKD